MSQPLLGDGVPYDADAPIYWGPGTDFAGQELWPDQRDRVLREANGRWLLGRDGSIAFMALDYFVSTPPASVDSASPAAPTSRPE